MKKEILKIISIGILLMLSVYSYADCIETSFKENYVKNFQRNDVYFIKGVALEVLEYGRTIKVIEDLKGNYIGESSIFVWGAGNSPVGCITIERWDIITQYQENDTLIMLISPVVFENSLETYGDYATITCAYSVLKLSDGFVTGYIYPWGDLWGETTISWGELQELLSTSNSAAIPPIRIKNNIYQHNGTIFFENAENNVVELSFYNLLGRLIHKTTTRSNSYRPIMRGIFFICRIKVNNKLYTMSYIVS